MYSYLRDQGYEIYDGKYVRRERDHAQIIGYDDVNQLFWYPEGIERIILEDKTRLVDIPPAERWDKLKDVNWKKVFFKTYRETRSWFHMITNFNRIWVIHLGAVVQGLGGGFAATSLPRARVQLVFAVLRLNLITLHIHQSLHRVATSRNSSSRVGLDRAELDEMAKTLVELKLFDNPDVVTFLSAFCTVTKETDRYVPLCNTIHACLDVMRENGCLSPQNPINDMVFFRNDPYYMRRPGEQGKVAAKRKPDILCTHKCEQDNHKAARAQCQGPKDEKIGIEWTGILSTLELKYNMALKTVLDEVREERGLSQLDFVAQQGKAQNMIKVSH